MVWRHRGDYFLPIGGIYTNQTHGFACEHPKEEGVFLPLPDVGPEAPRPLLRRLQQHFKGGWHHLLDDDADFIDGEFRSLGFGFITVDRTQIDRSFEAWVRVRLSAKSTDRFSPLCPALMEPAVF